MRFENSLERKYSLNKEYCVSNESLLVRLFHKEDITNCSSLMASYEFKNLIRDENSIFCIFGSTFDYRSRKINDSLMTFKELIGQLTQIS